MSEPGIPARSERRISRSRPDLEAVRRPGLMGEVIGGRYEVLEVLWTGGDTEVARGLDRRHERTVCLKITRVAPGDDPAPLLEEGRLLLGLKPHPTMPTVRDDLLLDDRYVLVVDWIDGTSTAQLLAERGDPGLPVTTVLGWLPDIASALDHLHAQRPSVVHGDVRPPNILITAEGRAVLVFGAAALRNAAATSIADDVGMLARLGRVALDRERAASPARRSCGTASHRSWPSDSIGCCAAPSTPTRPAGRPRRRSSSSGCRARRVSRCPPASSRSCSPTSRGPRHSGRRTPR